MKTEPHADVRRFAGAMWQFYVALTDEGFTDEQALTLIAQMFPRQQGGSDAA